MGGWVRTGAAWQAITAAWVRTGGAWQAVSNAWVRTGGAWQQWLSASALTPPSNLTLTAGTGQINVAFDDNSTGETKWEIRNDSDTLLQTVNSTTTAGTGTNYDWDHTGLTEDQTYYYKVRACDAVVCGTYTGTQNAKTKLTAPTSLILSTPTYDKITLDWNDNSTANTHYKIERDTGPTYSGFSVIDTVGDVETYDDTTVAVGVTYKYRVQAWKSDNTSDYSNVAEDTAYDLEAPTWHSSTGAYSNTAIGLYWVDKSTEETQFRIEACTGTSCSPTTFLTNSTGSSPASSEDTILPLTGNPLDTGLTEHTLRGYRIRAEDTGPTPDVVGPWSTTTYVRTMLNTPTGIGVVGGDSQVTVSWNNTSANETGYQVWRCTGSGCTGSFTKRHTTAANATSWVDTGVSNGTTYRYRIRAENTSVSPTNLSANSAISADVTPSAAQQAHSLQPNTNDSSSTGGCSGSWSGDKDSVNDFDTTDYVTSPYTTSGCTAWIEWGLENPSSPDPLSTQTHRLRARWQKYYQTGGTDTTDVDATGTLYQGTTAIASVSGNNLTTSWATDTYDLNGTEIGNITNYDALNFRVTFDLTNYDALGPDQITGRCGWVELQILDD